MFWLGAIASLCYVPGITGAYIATQWPLLAVVLPFALWRAGPLNWLHGIGVLFILYAAARIPFSPLPDAGVFGVWLLVIMGLCVWLGTTATSLRDLYAGLAVGASVSSAIAVAQFFGFDTVATGPYVASAVPGLYVNSVQQGAVLAVLIVALVSERMWLWVPALVPGLVLAGSRGAWVALAVGLLACRVRRLWVFGLVGAVGAFYLLSPLSSSDQLRVFIWRTAWDNLSLFGFGPGMFYALVMQRGGESFYPEHAHNDALQLVFEYGIAAVLPFVILAAALRRTAAAEWPTVVAFVAAGCYSMALYIPLVSFLALASVGRILRTYGMARSHSSYGRLNVVSRRDDGEETSCGTVPVAPNY